MRELLPSRSLLEGAGHPTLRLPGIKVVRQLLTHAIVNEKEAAPLGSPLHYHLTASDPYAFSILNTFVPHLGQTPVVAGLLFFMVTF